MRPVKGKYILLIGSYGHSSERALDVYLCHVAVWCHQGISVLQAHHSEVASIPVCIDRCPIVWGTVITDGPDFCSLCFVLKGESSEVARLRAYYPEYPRADFSLYSFGECLFRAFRARVVGGLRFGVILWNCALGQDRETVIQVVQQEFSLDCLQALVLSTGGEPARLFVFANHRQGANACAAMFCFGAAGVLVDLYEFIIPRYDIFR